jgi:hypothetical protein
MLPKMIGVAAAVIMIGGAVMLSSTEASARLGGVGWGSGRGIAVARVGGLEWRGGGIGVARIGGGGVRTRPRTALAKKTLTGRPIDATWPE